MTMFSPSLRLRLKKFSAPESTLGTRNTWGSPQSPKSVITKTSSWFSSLRLDKMANRTLTTTFSRPKSALWTSGVKIPRSSPLNRLISALCLYTTRKIGSWCTMASIHRRSCSTTKLSSCRWCQERISMVRRVHYRRGCSAYARMNRSVSRPSWSRTSTVLSKSSIS